MLNRMIKIVLLLTTLTSTAVVSFSMGQETGIKNEKIKTQIAIEAAAEEARKEALKEIESQQKEEETKEEILLVNKENALPQDYEVELVTLPDRVNRAAREAYEPLMSMLEAGRREGLSFKVCSSYRNMKQQGRLYVEDVIKLMRRGYSYENAYNEVGRETMPPGYSEHSTGLAFDIVAVDYQLLDANQEFTNESVWLRENCAEYGFILRYPKDKEHITGISFESWHFRYVGVEAAKDIMGRGITLEEYLQEVND